MGTRDPRVDAYIAGKAAFARPILTRLRENVHAACPPAEETLKWGMPAFMYRGGILCGIAAFKAHCALWFWKGRFVVDRESAATGGAMGQFGRITKLADLPSKRALTGYVKRAMALKEPGVKAPARGRRQARQPPAVPSDLKRALARSAKARATFEGFTPGHRREYLVWIAGAKRPETRARRLATAIEWLAQGKAHNWRYLERAAPRTSAAPLTSSAPRTSGTRPASTARRAATRR